MTFYHQTSSPCKPISKFTCIRINKLVILIFCFYQNTISHSIKVNRVQIIFKHIQQI